MLKALLRFRHNRALFNAIEEGSLQGVMQALSEGANPSARRNTYEIIPHAYENPTASGSESALYVAMMQPTISDEVVKALRDAGAQMDEKETSKVSDHLNKRNTPSARSPRPR